MEMQILPLEEFDGKVPMGTRLRLSGFAPQRTNDLHEGDEVILIVRGKVGSITFSTDAKGVRSRVHSAAIQEAYVIPEGDSHSPTDWLADIRSAHKIALDRHNADSPGGQQTLADDDATDEELAALEKELEAQEAEDANDDVEVLVADDPPVKPENMTDEEWEASGVREAEAEAEPVSPRAAAKLGKGKAGAR